MYYLAAGPKYVVFLLFSSVLTYLCGRGIAGSLEENKKRAKRILVIGLILNFGMLGVVKYTNFILENLNAIFRMELPGMAILLPLGISFYTFQSSGYLLDVYSETDNGGKEFFPGTNRSYSFFPQILQGPIGRHSKLAEQLYWGIALKRSVFCGEWGTNSRGFFKENGAGGWSRW